MRKTIIALIVLALVAAPFLASAAVEVPFMTGPIGTRIAGSGESGAGGAGGGGVQSTQTTVVTVESTGRRIIQVAETATTLVSAQATKPVLVNNQEIAATSTQGGGAGGVAPIAAQLAQTAPVIEVSVVETVIALPVEGMPPLPPNEENALPVLPVATSVPPVQAIPIEQARSTPPLNVGHLGPWHSMWNEGCVAGMRAPLNRVTYVYRQVRKCADGSFLDEKANQLMFLHGGYCNFDCTNRFYEHCIRDGSFDSFYVEQCLEIPIPTPGLAPTEVAVQGPTTPGETVESKSIAIDANSRVYNAGCQAALPDPFDKVLRVEREVRSCADDSLQQKQTILTKGDYCTFDCVDLKTETCADDAAGDAGVYVKEACFTSETAADTERVSTEQAQVVRTKLKKIRIERLQATSAVAPSEIKISSADASATTQLDVLVKNQRLFVKPADADEAQAKSVALMPDAAKAAVVSSSGAAPSSVSAMQLKIDAASGKAVYEIEAAKPVKIFGFIPASMPTTTTISAADASVVKEEKPWWNAISTA